MLRRPPTSLSVTSEDIAAYEDRRVREAQIAAQQARQAERAQRHAAMAARADAPSVRRRTQERIFGSSGTEVNGGSRLTQPPRTFDPQQQPQQVASRNLLVETPETMVPPVVMAMGAARASDARSGMPQIEVSGATSPTRAVGRGRGGMQSRFVQARQRQRQYDTPPTHDVDSSTMMPEDMDMEEDSESGPEDSMLEARMQMQARQLARERQGTPPNPRSRQARDERIGGGSGMQGGGAPSRRRQRPYSHQDCADGRR